MGRWRLQADKFLNFYIPIPPYDEQKKIADYITLAQATAILMQTPKAASEPVLKLLKSAAANAENNHQMDGMFTHP